jgi:hypothetical protein
MTRLEACKNHIPSSELVRREYAHVLLKAYQQYGADQQGKEDG